MREGGVRMHRRLPYMHRSAAGIPQRSDRFHAE